MPDEAAHSQYEMRSFVRSDSGVLHPTGQGRLADPSNPVLSNTVTNLTSPVTIPVNVPGLLPKPVLPKLAKEKPKSRTSTGKAGRTAVGYPAPAVAVYQEELPANLSTSFGTDRPTVGSQKEDHEARQSRLNAYDDAIESVLRKAQETDDGDVYEQIASDFGNEDEPFIPPAVAAGKNLDRDERQAQIADTIDAVIARTFHDSDLSQSSPLVPVASPPPYDDEDEIIEVHSVSPLKVEVTTDDVLILPPPPASPITVQTLAERKFMPEEEVSKSGRPKKTKSRPQLAASEVYGYDKEDDDFTWSSSHAKSPDIHDHLKFGIPDSYVKLEEMASARKGRQVVDDEEEMVDFSQPLPMDAAESLMKLAGVAPPPKRLKISYGSGRDRIVENTRDDSEDREIYEPKMTSTTKPGLVTDDLDLEECSQRSTASDLLTLEHGQRLVRDDRGKNRSRETTKEKTEVQDTSSADVEESLVKKPAGKKGRPRKGSKKRGRVSKAAVISLGLCF